MGLYIEGMEMPDKATTIVIFPEGEARVFRQDIDHDEWLRLTAIEVPIPHGDLIERDKLLEKEFIHAGDAYAVVMSRDIRNAPTIIPAEPPKEET